MNGRVVFKTAAETVTSPDGFSPEEKNAFRIPHSTRLGIRNKGVSFEANRMASVDCDISPSRMDRLYLQAVPTAAFMRASSRARELGVAALESAQDPSHDKEHLDRVYALVEKIVEEEGGFSFSEAKVALVGALLHDYADAKLLGPNETKESALERLRTVFLCPSIQEGSLTEVEALKIEQIVLRTGFSVMRREAREALADVPSRFKELDVVRDADLLDSIGAHGIARCVVFGTVRSRPLRTSDVRLCEWESRPGNLDPPPFESDVPAGGSVEHFYEKLLRVPAVLATQTAKRMAVSRLEIMKSWLRHLDDEANVGPLVHRWKSQ